MQKQEAINIIETTFNAAFSEEKFTLFIKNLLNDIDTTRYNEYHGQYIKDAFKDHIKQYKRIGKYTDPNGDALDVLIVEVKDQTKLDKTRTALRNFVISHLDSFEKDFALVAFYSKSDHGADWRFSFVKLEYKTEVKEGKLKQSKGITPAKRYSFLVGEHEKAHTAKKQLLPLLENIYNNPTLEELEEAFSIEKVTNEFFEQYKALFLKLSEQFELDTNGLKEQLSLAGIDIPRFTKKLLGQIVFLYFLQKKGWLGVPKEQKWGAGHKKYLQHLFTVAEENGENYFGDYLQPLFYEALAHKHNDEGVNGYFSKLGCKVPFLNGGLFEADYKWEEDQVTIPNDLFRNQDKVQKTGDVGTGVLDVFDRYNFTIKEDEPLEKEVAVDPEMLGKVFENMLDVTERKSKGAFYTPREIVHYMCQESLIHYLDNAVNSYAKTYQELGTEQTNLFGNAGKSQGSLMKEQDQITVPKADIDFFIRKGFLVLENDQRVIREGKETKTYNFKIPDSIRNSADILDKKLTEIKVCDPAIGSGAFPVGLLHELINAQLVLKQYLSNAYFDKKLSVLGISSTELEKNPDKYNYRLKRHTIQESIYGVDVDASAIDIARLRLWLSLVVNEEDLDNIEALPNLDYKIVCGNSLIGLPENAMRNLEIEKELEDLKEQFFIEIDEANKKNLRTQINTKIRQLLDTAEEFAGSKIEFDFKLFFSEVWQNKGGFDVVIGNPPYLIISSDLFKTLYKNHFKFIEGKPDLYRLFIEKGSYLHNKQGVLSYIIPNTMLTIPSAKKLRKYLLSKYWIPSIVHFESSVFNSASVNSIVFLCNENKVDHLCKCTLLTPQNKTLPNNKYSLLNSEEWLENDKHEWNIFIDDQVQKIFNKIKKDNTTQLGLEFKISLGLQPYHNTIHSKQEIESRFLHSDDKNNENFILELGGKNVQKYKVVKPKNKRYLDFSAELYTKPNISFFRSPKIIIREITSKTLIAGFTNEFILFNKSCYLVVNKDIKKLKFLLGILNSEFIGFWIQNIGDKSKQRLFPRVTMNTLKKIPLVLDVNYLKFSLLVDYCIHLKDNLIFSYIQDIVNACVFELYFPTELKKAGKEILKHLGNLKPISDSMSDEEKLAIIQSEFERLYDPNHPVRNNVETLESVEEVRIIKEALK